MICSQPATLYSCLCICSFFYILCAKSGQASMINAGEFGAAASSSIASYETLGRCWLKLTSVQAWDEYYSYYCSCRFCVATQSDEGKPSCCCEIPEVELVIPMVNPACVVTTTMSKAENVLGGALRSSPGGWLLPATDGSNCAEMHVSRALIIYAVCCVLLSKVPCSAVSAYCIFSRTGPMGGTMWIHHKLKGLVVFVGTMNLLSLSSNAGRSMVQKTCHVGGDIELISIFSALELLLTLREVLFANYEAGWLE